jgi:glycine dehydrogenase
MLKTLGYDSLDALTAAAVPAEIADSDLAGLPAPHTAEETRQELLRLADSNQPMRSLIGMGYSGTITPAPIRRLIVENPAWYTAYTPYQPEISQGRLEALFTFQTMISDLTGLPVAGASLLDEATAVAEAVALARRAVRSGAQVVLDADLYPQSLAVVETRARSLHAELVVAEDLLGAVAESDLFAVVVQVPGANGRVRPLAELRALAAAAHDKGALVIAACDPLALALLAAPAEWGADVAVGSVQRFGVPLYFGGPHAGYIAVRSGLERQLPGRLVGQSQDSAGNPAFRLALQTREQHIRREKATSNICTAQVLLAVVASCYAVWHGPEGIARIARDVHAKALAIARAATSAGIETATEDVFDTLRLHLPGQARQVVAQAAQLGFALAELDDDWVGLSVGEDLDWQELELLVSLLAPGAAVEPVDATGPIAGHIRTGGFLTHRVFNSYQDETEFMRYLRALSDRDYALDKGMIPLGSCTMKLNPAFAMEPISYPGFADLHPLADPATAAGYQELIAELCGWLAAITGYDAVSLQPNAGSQGEFAGLLAIRRYHDANQAPQRTVCLIPASAHGTNAASAAMAGLRVVQVATAADGSIDAADLRAKVAEHRDELAAIMVTYPSTHGVFETGIGELCALVHDAGGQVYVDGANFNALMGLAKPGKFGADVSHLNLHKTFAIPHGGGGPGVGPVAVRAHLAEFLPALGAEPGRVSAAPFGSPGVLPISYAYIYSQGAAGLRAASQQAILRANYLAKRLGGAYPILYTGQSGLVAHECILDLRAITKESGVSVDDVAKRLIDYGFHAPTMSFPVSGTLMVEPTESESLAELDRFADAMLAIRAEIDQVAQGVWPHDDNPLHNAPHTVAAVTGQWDHPYPRQLACCLPSAGPLAAGGRDKYWPPVGRIDNAYGDRNLVVRFPE